MRLTRISRIALVAGTLAALAGCQGQDEMARAPQLPGGPDTVEHDLYHHLDRIDISGDYACPVGGDTLYIFSQEATAPRDGSELHVGEVVLRPGDSFLTGPVEFLDEGYLCGELFFDTVEHITSTITPREKPE
ncbi:MAG: hypothetical protein Q4P33_07505 [Flaviflexus sp.]|nr:hypothetical protein [Flaviflexus sp.]